MSTKGIEVGEELEGQAELVSLPQLIIQHLQHGTVLAMEDRKTGMIQ